MEENETPHPDYLKGFNEGYLLSKHMPEVAQQISLANPESSRSEGFIAGREQYAFEMKESRRPAWLRKDRLHDLDPDKNTFKERELDKDHPEPDI